MSHKKVVVVPYNTRSKKMRLQIGCILAAFAVSDVNASVDVQVHSKRAGSQKEKLSRRTWWPRMKARANAHAKLLRRLDSVTINGAACPS